MSIDKYSVISLKDIVILSWNCRGVNNRVTRNSIRALKDKIKADLLCLQEIKCHEWNKRLANQIWGSSNHDWVVEDSQGRSGGLACSWDNSVFQFIGLAQDRHWIRLQL